MAGLLAFYALLGSAALAASSGGGSPVPRADLILYGGRVLTLGALEPSPSPTAVAMLSDRIVFVGDDPGALALRDQQTQMIDLEGAVVIPGFCDAHCHLYGLGKALAEVDLMGTASALEVVARVQKASAGLPAGSWLQGRGWDQNDWSEPEFPHRSLLDAAGLEWPVLLRRVDGHAAWVNSRALKAAGIDAMTPDPAGGKILRGPDGEPTGILIDNAVDLVRNVIPAESRAELRRRIKLAMQHCLRHGITGVHEAGMPAQRLALYKQMAAAGELDLRIYGLLEDDPQTLAAGLAGGPFRSRDGMLTVRGVKLYCDGALGSRGALLLNDYRDDPGNRGLQVTSREHLSAVAERAGRAGFQVCTHAIGDAANRLVLDLYEELSAKLDLSDARWRVEHAQVLAPGDLPRFARLGVIASMQPVHCTSDMDWAEARLGPERTRGAYAWRSLLDSGAQLCFGTDFPVEKVDPLAGLYAARTRTHADGTPQGGWRAGECLTAEEALRLYTSGSAYAAFAEEELGRVEAGMLADLTVLSGDPTRGAARELFDLDILLTVVGGRVRFAGR